MKAAILTTVVVVSLAVALRSTAKLLWKNPKLNVSPPVNKKEEPMSNDNADDRLRAALVNMNEVDATGLVNREGRQTFVAERDGEGFPCTAIFDENRVRLIIRDGKVTGVEFG